MPKSQKIGKSIAVIPDCQVKPGVDISHLTWIGNYIVDKQPEILINLGDFSDLPSLSYFDKGKLEAEGKRYSEDVKFTRHAMDQLLKPIKKYNSGRKNKYEPRMILTLGNHEARITRTASENPNMAGTLNIDDLGYKEAGWEVHPFLKVVKVEGIEVCHYFQTPGRGMPVSSAAALLRLRQCSAIQGHSQATDIALSQTTGNMAMFCGTCYLHDEEYRGFQGNVQRRQIVMLNQVDGSGYFDPCLVSLKFLGLNYN